MTDGKVRKNVFTPFGKLSMKRKVDSQDLYGKHRLNSRFSVWLCSIFGSVSELKVFSAFDWFLDFWVALYAIFASVRGFLND